MMGARKFPQPEASGSVSPHFFPRDEYFMRLALREAARALEHDDVPIGAAIVKDGEVIGLGHNERELRSDPTAHAEMIALRQAAQASGGWRILDTVMYVTLEPCAMCAGAIVLARVPRIVFGAWDPKAGAAGSVLDVLDEPSSTTGPGWRPGCWLMNRRSCYARSLPRGEDEGLDGGVRLRVGPGSGVGRGKLPIRSQVGRGLSNGRI